MGRTEGHDLTSKTDIKLAWMRLGFPAHISDYFISIDSDRRTLIRIPAAYAAWSKRLRKDIPPEVIGESLPQPFKVVRGTSQGSVLSPTTWLAFFDILLVALSHVKEDIILLPGLPEKLIFVHDPAYIDDLITQSATLELLQQKADIISAFCIIFGLDIALKKLRSYVANWSATDITINRTLQVHSGDCIAQAVQLQISTKEEVLALKNLGIHHILNNTSTTQLNILSTYTQRVALRIATRRASAPVK